MLFYGKTDVRRRRAANQDDFIIKKFTDDTLIAVVCDGMGGANGGNIASAVASTSFMKILDEAEANEPAFFGMPEEKLLDLLAAAVDEANISVYDLSAEDPSLTGMGTTLVGCVIRGDKLFVVNVGDSRLYVFRENGFEQISHDHSYVQLLVDMGKLSPEEAKKSKNKNLITRAVGTERKVLSDVFTADLAHGDTIVLCSDGLTNLVDPEEIAEEVKKALENEDLQPACENLVALANERGGLDNITAVLLSV